MKATPMRDGKPVGLRLVFIPMRLACDMLKHGISQYTPLDPAPDDVEIYAALVTGCGAGVSIVLGSVRWPQARPQDVGFTDLAGLPAIMWAPTFRREQVPQGGKS